MELLRDKKVKIRKPHRCFGCCREFAKGTEMRFSVWVDGGTANNFYLCQTCQKVEADLTNEFGGNFEYSEGQLLDEAIEYENKEQQQ